MKRLFALALLAAVALGCGGKTAPKADKPGTVTMARFTPPPGWTPPPIFTPTPPPSGPPVVNVPQASYTLKDSDPACLVDTTTGQPWPRAVTVPLGSAVVCNRQAISDYLRAEVVAGRLTAGASGVCRGLTGAPLDSCIAYQFSLWPPVVYGMTPRFIPQLSLCAAGVTWDESIEISLAQPWRVLPLVAWEHANHLVVVKLDRYDLGDGSFTAAASAAAQAACPVN